VSVLAAALALVVLALGVLLWRERREFRKLRDWASQRRLADPPEAIGGWGEVFTMLHRHRRSMLRRRRQLAQLIVRSRRGAQALPYGVAILDARYRLDWCNTAAREHLGFDPEQDRGQPVVNFIRQPEFVAYVARGDFNQPLRMQSGVAPSRTLSLQIV
jgi:two-component system, OmpR family, phosphate regulon sensor histidine kinase PhoR